MSDGCLHCVDQTLQCPECKCGCDLDPTTDVEDGDKVECLGCGEEWYVWLGQLVDADEYHENSCDSQAAADYEERAYGDDDSYVSSRVYRNEDHPSGDY